MSVRDLIIYIYFDDLFAFYHSLEDIDCVLSIRDK